MRARAGHFGGERDDRGGMRDKWEHPYTRRRNRQAVRQDARDLVKALRVRAVRSA